MSLNLYKVNPSIILIFEITVYDVSAEMILSSL